MSYRPTPQAASPAPRFPPPVSLGIEGQRAASARLIDAAAFAVTVAVVGAVVRRATESAAAVLFAVLLVLSASPMLLIHSMAWSEPVFVSLLAIGFMSMAQRADDAPQPSMAVPSMVLAAACLTRFSGIPFVPASGIYYWISAKKGVAASLRRPTAFVCLAAAPLGAWVARGWLTDHGIGGRPILIHLVPCAKLAASLEQVAAWFVPWRLAGPVSGVLVWAFLGVLAAPYLARLLRETRSDRQPRDNAVADHTVSLSMLWVAAYFAFLLVSISLVDYSIPFDQRLLAPMFPFMTIGLTVAVSGLLRGEGSTRPGRMMACVVAGFVVARSLTLGVEWVHLRSGDGDTYSKRDFFTSDLARAARAIPQECAVFSDSPDAVWFLARYGAQRLPARWSPFSRQANPRFEDELRAIGSLTARQPVRVVYFDVLKRGWFAGREDLGAVATVHLQLQTSLGAVYELAARD